MKHCHFSILYNELPFLKQKLPFLYEHFDQLIFFDLNVGVNKPHYSNDGSHEYIKEYPDPQNKISLIEETDLSKVSQYTGEGSVPKQKMFGLGSQYVESDMSVFWCTDMDEFFAPSLIKLVEKTLLDNPEVNSIDLEHFIFWKDFATILATPTTNTMKLFSRIARHREGNLYGHCSLHQQYAPCKMLQEEKYYHFAWVGEERYTNKINHYTLPPTGNPNNREAYQRYTQNIWANPPIIKDGLVGYPHMHPNPSLKYGVKRYEGELPAYLNILQLEKDLL
jgi:hypothetical protein